MNTLKKELMKRSNGEKIHKFFSPARINLIGEHIDYVGGSVMPAAINIGIKAYACKSNNIEIFSQNLDQKWQVDNDFYKKREYHKKYGYFNFVYGIINELKTKLQKHQGFKLVLQSNIPIASGLSSSAAFGMLIIKILVSLYDIKISKKERALLFKNVENNFIKLKSGIMDQFAIEFGKKNNFLLLNTNTLEYKYIENNPIDYQFIIFSTNKPRQLVDSKYNERVEELKKVAKILQMPFHHLFQAKMDQLNNIQNNILKKRLKHVITENKRVITVSDKLNYVKGQELGQIINESHNSLKNDYEVSCEELNFIQENLNKSSSFFGARMIGAGFGGCVLAVAKKTFKDGDIDFGQKYKNKFGYDFEYFKFNIVDGVREIND